MKYKYQIERRMFYLEIILLSISSILMTIWLTESLIFGTKIYDGLEESVQNEKYTFYVSSKIIAYIVNSIILVGFAINLLISKKSGVGFIFSIIWIICFIGMIAFPNFSPSSYENPLRIVINVLLTISFVLILISLIFILYKVYENKKIHKYERYKIHKGR